jgi:polygalacturonase
MDIFVKDYGILPNTNEVLHTKIQKAIDDCHNSGGGSVHFEPGVYITGTIYLKDNVYLNIPPRAVIKGSDHLSDYNEPDAWVQNAPIYPEYASGKHLIVGVEVKNCGLYGGGIVDGNGKHFGFRKEEGFLRPSQMVYFCESQNIRISNLELLNSPYWTCHIHGCDNVIITGIKIKNNEEIENCDGIDIDTSSRVVVSDCIIQSQDDCITFRCDNNFFGKLKNKDKILEDVTVTNCQLSTASCNAIRIGVGHGKIKNCLVSNIIIKNSAKAVCLESRYAFNGDDKIGTTIENISFNNIYMETKLPLFIANHCDGINNLACPDVRNIRFTNITSISQHNVIIQGNENCVLENINFANCDFSFIGTPDCVDKYGYGEWDYVTSPSAFYIANAKNVSLNNVQIHILDKNSAINKGITEINSQMRYIQVYTDIAGEIIDSKGV